MYCSNCGQAAAGNFCASCGHALNGPPPIRAEIVPIDWRTETNYERLISVPEVRERIARAGKAHRKQMTGEELLATFDVLVPTGISLEKLATLIQPLYAKLGLNVGRSMAGELPLPTGQVLVGVLCAMAEHGHELRHVEQADEGCSLCATIPSTIWSFAGELLVTVRRGGNGTLIQAATKVPGQWTDWGRSQRVLDTMFQRTAALAA